MANIMTGMIFSGRPKVSTTVRESKPRSQTLCTLQTDVLSVASAAAAMNSMRQDYIFYKRAYEDNSQSPMWSYMHEYFVRQYSELVKEKTGTEPDARTQFNIRLYCYGTLGMTREWLLKDNITPADVIVRMMFDSMPDHLRKIYF